MSSGLHKLRVSELKALLTERDLPTSGLKQDLIDRLQQASVNDDDGVVRTKEKKRKKPPVQEDEDAPEELTKEGAADAAKAAMVIERAAMRSAKEEDKARRRRLTALPQKGGELPVDLLEAALEQEDQQKAVEAEAERARARHRSGQKKRRKKKKKDNLLSGHFELQVLDSELGKPMRHSKTSGAPRLSKEELLKPRHRVSATCLIQNKRHLTAATQFVQKSKA